MERVVKSRLIDHLASNNLLNLQQTTYCKHHSTETALLYSMARTCTEIEKTYTVGLSLLHSNAHKQIVDY